jgi:hypothetical protein
VGVYQALTTIAGDELIGAGEWGQNHLANQASTVVSSGGAAPPLGNVVTEVVLWQLP